MMDDTLPDVIQRWRLWLHKNRRGGPIPKLLVLGRDDFDELLSSVYNSDPLHLYSSQYLLGRGLDNFLYMDIPVVWTDKPGTPRLVYGADMEREIALLLAS